MRIRKCPYCDRESYNRIFDFTYEYLQSVKKIDPKILEMAGFTVSDHASLVSCDGCSFLYIREHYGIDETLDAYYTKTDYVRQHLTGTDFEGNSKTVSDRLYGQNLAFAIVQNLLHLTIYGGRTFSNDKKLKFLDYGCGWGGWLKVAQLYNFVEAIGFDISEYKLKYVSGFGIKTTTTYEELQHIGPFDVIVCNDVLEHVANPKAAVRDIVALLAKGGIAYIDTTILTPKQIKAGVKQMQVNKSLKSFHLGHINYFQQKHYLEIMKSNNLVQINAHPILFNAVGSMDIQNLKYTVRPAMKALGKFFLYYAGQKRRSAIWRKP